MKKFRRAALSSAMVPFCLAFAAHSLPAEAAQAQDAGYPYAFQGWGGVPTGPNTWLFRWAEDWTALCDPANRQDALDALKCIPLGSGDTWLSLDNEERLRFDTYSNPSLNDAASQRDYMLRVFLGADLHLNDHVSAYAQLAHGTYNGHNLTAKPATQDNDLMLQQAFVDFSGQWHGVDTGVRLGRQGFMDGPIQIVGAREDTNIQLTLNGVRAWAIADDKRLTLFHFNFNAEDSGIFGDQINHGRRVSGGIGGLSFPSRSGVLDVEPLWFHSVNNATSWGGETGREERDFYGIYSRGHWGRWSMDAFGVYEDGDFENRDISAHGFYATLKWQVANTPMKPKIGFHSDFTSGGGAYGNGKLHDASFLFAVAPYLSYAPFIGGINLITVAPNFEFSPTRSTHVLVEYEMLRRDASDDAVYNALAVPYSGTQLSQGHDVGGLWRLNFSWQMSRRLSLTTRAEYLDAGPVLTDAGHASSAFVGTWLQYRI